MCIVLLFAKNTVVKSKFTAMKILFTTLFLSFLYPFLGITNSSVHANDITNIYVSRNEMGPYGYNFYTGGTLGDWASDYNGQMIITANLGDSFALPTFNRSIWCIDQLGYIGLGDNPNLGNDSGIIYEVGSLADFTTTRVPNGIINITRRQASQIAALAYTGDQMLRKSPSNVVSNAVQAAITNIQYGTTSDGGTEVKLKTMELMDWVSGLTDAQLARYQMQIYISPTGEQQTGSAYIIPEPSSILSILGLGTLGAASTLKRQLKSSKSSEKETTKVS